MNNPITEDIPELIIILIVLLLTATVVALITQKLRISYVAGLVLAGLPISELLSRSIGLDPALVFNLFLPILIFEAAINTDISRLRSTFKAIALLAGPGSVLSAVIIGTAVKLFLGLDWIAALLLGVILATTDTVSMIAVFKDIRVPSRLSTIVEGETLFNDTASLVLFNLILGIYATGNITVGSGIREILGVGLGGGILGVVLGYLCLPIFVRLQDPLSSLLLTVALALGTFQLGQILGVSGAVAVVIAGLIFGNLGLSKQTSASDRITLTSFWQYASFIVNTFIFLLIGIEIEPLSLWENLPSIAVVILAYQLGRVLSVYPLLAGLRWLDRPIPWRWQHVLTLGNIKGSLSMALAVTIPLNLTGREFIIQLVFGSVFFSLVVQGLALPWLIKRLNIGSISAEKQEIGKLQIQIITAKAAQGELGSLLNSGLLSKADYEEIWASYQAKIATAERQLQNTYQSRSSHSERHRLYPERVLRQLLLAEKGAVGDVLRKRVIPEDIAQAYLKNLDKQLLSLDDD